VISFDYDHVDSITENLRFSDFPKWSPRGRATGKVGIISKKQSFSFCIISVS
jgi:hypothetical protein